MEFHSTKTENKEPNLQVCKESDIAIIGVGFRLPGDNNEPTELWKKLKCGFDGIQEFENERISKNYSILDQFSSNKAGLVNFEQWKSFDPMFFGISNSECSNIDPQQRLSLISTWEALEDAHLDPVELRGTNTSVFMGSFSIDYTHGLRDRCDSKPNTLASNFHCLSNRISYCFDLRGQSLSIDTACSSSSNAIISGCKTIIDGTSNISICGGSNLIIDPCFSNSISSQGMNSHLGHCMSFDASADGYVRSEGCGILVLKKLSEAIKDGNKIYCVIKGFSSNNDGNVEKGNFFAPSVLGQYLNIELAFKSTLGTVSPDDIYFVECHGTGTPVGDPIELESISKALKTSISRSPTSPLLIGSFKSNIGHTEAASGVASLIKCCLMFRHRKLVPNINFNKPNPRINFKDWNLKVVTEKTSFPKDKQISIMINNFGVTGSNTCFILSEYVEENNNNNEMEITNLLANDEFLIPFSSMTNKSMEKYKNQIENFYVNQMDFVEFVSKQIYTKTTQLSQRSVVFSKLNWEGYNKESILTQSNKVSNFMIKSIEPTVVFVFPGQGPQFNKMGIDLYEKEPVFRNSMNEINEIFKSLYGYSVLDKLRSIKDDDNTLIHLPSIGQPAMVMIEISLFKLLKNHWNIQPSFIVGHSLGEVAASFCSGMIDLETCCKIVYVRSTLQDSLVGFGKMLSVTITEEEYNKNYLSQFPLLEIACFNSNNFIVISGNEQDLIKLSNLLKSNSIPNLFLGTNVSYHSSSQIKIKNEMISGIGQYKCNEAVTPIISTLTCEFFNPTQHPFNAEYNFKSSRSPVYFKGAIESLYKHIEDNNIGSGSVTFVEISPHPVLSFYLNELKPQNSNHFSPDAISILPTLNRKKNDIKEIQKTVSTLYCQGCNVNFKSQFNGIKNLNGIINVNKKSSKDLPRYQWDLQNYWNETNEAYLNRINGPPITILGNSNSLTSPLISMTTLIDISKEPFHWLKDHVVNDKFYFPGCGYIDNILNLYPNQDLLIEYLEFKLPFILKENKNFEMTTNITQTAPNQNNVYFHIKDQKTNQWVQSSRGNFSVFEKQFSNSPPTTNKYNIESLKLEHNYSHLLKSDFYDYVKRITGINFKGCFQRVQECWIGENYSTLVKISTKNLLSVHDNKVFLNPSIIDNCLQGFFVSSFIDPSVAVFDRIEHLKIYSSNIPNVSSKFNDEETFIYAIAKNNTDNSLPSNSFSGSVVAFSENGQIILEAKNVIGTSLVPVTDSTLPEYPTEDLFSFILEPIDSQILTTLPNQSINEFENEKNSQLINSSIYKKMISNLLYNNLKSRLSNQFSKELLFNNSADQLLKLFLNKANSKYSRLLNFVFETLKESIDDLEETKFDFTDSSEQLLFSKSSKIISKLLFPMTHDDDENQDTPQSLLDSGLIDNLFSKLNFDIYSLSIANKITESIKPLLEERIVFRIMIIDSKFTLSENLIKSMDQLINQNSNILIELTISDTFSSFTIESKKKLPDLITNTNNINLLFQTLNFESSFQSQSFKPSYYDIITLSNVLHVTNDIQFSIEQINGLLKSNGDLLFIEIPKSIIYDIIFGSFEQWWSFTDFNIRNDRCCMDADNWVKILSVNGFKNSIISSSNNSSLPFIIQTKKHELILEPINQHMDFDIILYTGNSYENSKINDFISLMKNELFENNNGKIKIIKTIKEFKNQEIQDDNKSIIFFLPSIVPLEINNYNETSLELFEVGQFLIDCNKTKCKIVVISENSQSESINYLNSSVLGVMKYFENTEITVYSLDYDNQSISNIDTVKSTINSLILNSNKHIQIEYIIRDNKVYSERLYRESIDKTFSVNFNNQIKENEIYTKLNTSLQYELNIKPNQLKSKEIEIKVLASGINYEDNLKYNDLLSIPNELRTFGNECSGVITKIGNDVKEFKVGDYVLGFSNSTTSSHIIINENSNCFVLKPENLNYITSSSIPYDFLKSYYSIFKIGNLDIEDDESILIHMYNSISDGFGICALNLLKWKGFKPNIFVTVDSIEKKQFLEETYGSFITGIYLSGNFVKEIKETLKQFGSEKTGVDLILNTSVGDDFMVSNFECLCQGGRIVDISNKLKNNYNHSIVMNKKLNEKVVSYHRLDLSLIPFKKLKPILKSCVDSISNGELEVNESIINCFSVLDIKEAIESCSGTVSDCNIGKKVVDMDIDLVENLVSSQSQIVLNKNNYKLSSLGKTVLVTGQTGIVLEILKWIISNSTTVENIIILSFSKLKWELKLLINQTMKSKSNKIKFYYKSVDVGDLQLLNQAIDQIYNENEALPKVETIFHFAFQFVDTKVSEIGIEDFKKSTSSKVDGAINLHNISLERNWKLKNFVLSSSIATVMYHSNAPTYVCANNVLDSLSRYRKSIGLPCTSINIGFIKSTGLLLKKSNAISESLESYGITPIKPNKIFGTLDLLFNSKNGNNNDKYPQSLNHNLMLCSLNLNVATSYLNSIKFSYKFDYYTNIISLEKQQQQQSLSKLGNNESLSVPEFIINTIADHLTIEPTSLNINLKLQEYGADSLHATIFKNMIEKQFNELNILTTSQIQTLTIKSIIKIVNEKVTKKK
ncbi:hypothetical protein ACTFIW_011487 [Dictyostelium discoideum]